MGRIFYYSNFQKLNKRFFLVILLIAYFAALLRFYIDNNLIVSFIGSFLYGFVIARKIDKSKKEILLSGFCSCFTSFTGFIYFLYKFINQGYYLKFFIYLNLIIILNLITMYIGFFISRKIK